MSNIGSFAEEENNNDGIKEAAERKPSASWHNFNLNEGLSYILSTGHLADCSFVVIDNEGNSKSFPCHKLVLACASPVFEAMFFGNFKESNSPTETILEDVDAVHFQIFLECIYHKNYEEYDNLDICKLIGIYTLAHKYMVQPLATSCIESLKIHVTNLTAKEFVALFVFSRRFAEESLIDEIFYALEDSADLLCLSNCTELYKLTCDDFIDFFRRLKYIYTETQRFALIEQYGKYIDNVNEDVNEDISSIVNKETVLKEKEEEGFGLVKLFASNEAMKQRTNAINVMLSSIDFKKMTPHEFCSGPGKSKLLTFEQKFTNLQFICGMNSFQRLSTSAGPIWTTTWYCRCYNTTAACTSCGGRKIIL